MKPKFYLTTPPYPVHLEPDLSHLYTAVIADALARYKRLRGFQVFSLAGTHENGLQTERTARNRGVDPGELARRSSSAFREVLGGLGARFDEYVQNSDPRHRSAATEIARLVGERGFLYRAECRADYCLHCETVTPEAGDGCPVCGGPTEPVTGENHFFRLSRFQEKLLQFYESNPDFVMPPERMTEIVGFVKGGPADVCISRASSGWGTAVPDDPNHVLLLWFDALAGYLSGVGYPSDDKGFASLWPADVQVIGRDLLLFHAVYGPALLMAAGLEPPRRVLVNGWWTANGERMSAAKDNLITARELGTKLPPDCIRYYLLREMPVGADGDFSYEALVARVNRDLSKDVGNLANRTLKMIETSFDARIPEAGEFEGGDQGLIRFSRETVDLYRQSFDRLQIDRALENVWELVSAANQYIDATKPWLLAREPSRRDRLANVLYVSAETLRIVALLLSPIVPDGSATMLRSLGIDTPPDGPALDSLRWGGLKAGTRIEKTETLYRRLDLGALLGRTAPESAGPQENTSAGDGERISIEDFAKVDMRVGRIVAAERIAKSAKLLKLRVDLGSERRQLVAGIGEVYDPEALIGILVAVVVNLKPATLMGVESNGMIVAASDEGRPVLTTFNEPVSLGARLR